MLCYNVSVKDKGFWVQLLVSTVIPLILGGGTIFAFSLFEERLPDWAYNTLISIFYVFFVIFLAVFAVMLIRLAFGEWFNKLQRWYNERTEYRKNLKLVTNWSNKWSDLSKLLVSARDSDWKTNDEQVDEYSMLRSWLRRNRSEFLPIWHRFQRARRSAAHERPTSSSNLAHDVFYNNYDDPFSYFYEPLAIEEFERILRHQERDMAIVLIKLHESLEECFEWVKLE